MKDKWYIVNYPSEEQKLGYVVNLVRMKLRIPENTIAVKIPRLRIKELINNEVKFHNIRMFPGYGFIRISDGLKKDKRNKFLLEMDIYDYSVHILKYSSKSGWNYYTLSPEELKLITNMEKGKDSTIGSKIKKGDVVEIRKGLFEGFDGIVEKIRRDEIFVSIMFLGKSYLIKTDESSLKVLGSTDLVTILKSRNNNKEIKGILELGNG